MTVVSSFFTFVDIITVGSFDFVSGIGSKTIKAFALVLTYKIVKIVELKNI